MIRVPIPEPIRVVHPATGQPYRVIDDDAPDDKKKFDDKGRQIGPLKIDDPWSHKRFLASWVLPDKRFSDRDKGNKVDAWRAMHRILDALDDAEKEGRAYYDVRKEDWERLRKVLESWKESAPKDDEKELAGPRAGDFNDMLFMNLLPHIESVLGAKEVDEGS